MRYVKWHCRAPKCLCLEWCRLKNKKTNSNHRKCIIINGGKKCHKAFVSFRTWNSRKFVRQKYFISLETKINPDQMKFSFFELLTDVGPFPSNASHHRCHSHRTHRTASQRRCCYYCCPLRHHAYCKIMTVSVSFDSTQCCSFFLYTHTRYIYYKYFLNKKCGEELSRIRFCNSSSDHFPIVIKIDSFSTNTNK